MDRPHCGRCGARLKVRRHVWILINIGNSEVDNATEKAILDMKGRYPRCGLTEPED